MSSFIPGRSKGVLQSSYESITDLPSFSCFSSVTCWCSKYSSASFSFTFRPTFPRLNHWVNCLESSITHFLKHFHFIKKKSHFGDLSFFYTSLSSWFLLLRSEQIFFFRSERPVLSHTSRFRSLRTSERLIFTESRIWFHSQPLKPDMMHTSRLETKNVGFSLNVWISAFWT